MADPKRSKRLLGLILGIPIAVILLSSAVYYLAKENIVNFRTVNRGTLINPPMQLGDLHPQRLDGGEFLFDRADSRWVYMVVGGRECTDACERMLYLTRQTHTALGKKVGRVELVYLAVDGPLSANLRDFLESEHSDTTVLHVNGNEFLGKLQNLEIDPFDPQAFYVVDPKGWVMMYYRAGDTELPTLTTLGKDVLKDMGRLIK
ncbi:Uncharacterised protein [Zhongshania aliphaticivorans]|uniref:Thioredoxin domain-containing protein n=2 Tax=Zhongshania aliphaticivorans TaxID=1470434 RepID=A0A5S9PLN1_9GAMM|nr:Uncharacterised protein [Zhongshania aliphaticivorans]CAA0105110.1 Uncharacterised protein [Zhongshania aliphaticivorans]